MSGQYIITLQYDLIDGITEPYQRRGELNKMCNRSTKGTSLFELY